MIDENVLSMFRPSREDDQAMSREEKLKWDYKVCCISREISILARRDVLTGKAKFGITGDGKELPQVVMAHHFRKGDFRSGYYRDQTFMLAIGHTTVEDNFAQLYADPVHDPFSGGRQMNNHFASHFIDANGEWTRHVDLHNITSDISSTGGQMGRALGLALASKLYRQQQVENQFSSHGNEVVFCTIGDASTSEGVFWETINSAAVQQVPLAVFVYDDGYGISVPIDYQTAKGSISEALRGFESDKEGEGIDLYTINGYDYAALDSTIRDGIDKVRREHKPAVFHIKNLTQPQGHSTSGSHERYKSKERLQWEREHDCIKKLEDDLLNEGLLDEDDVTIIRKDAKQYVRKCRNRALEAFEKDAKDRFKTLKAVYADLPVDNDIEELAQRLNFQGAPLLSELTENARQLRLVLRRKKNIEAGPLQQWIDSVYQSAATYYHRHLYAEDGHGTLDVAPVPVKQPDDLKKVNGYEVLNAFFDKQLSKNDQLLAFGEDVGKIGGVNQGFAGLQEKHGEHRVFDTAIREWTIMGQAIGLAMRGLRPIAEIQYLDYLIYGLQPLVDDLSTLRWRSNGKQMAPVIVRTRGHRLEGIWHSGSPLGMMVNSLRGMYVCVPRNMVQAAGMYNTLLKGNDPGIVVECLNGYRLKEVLPANIGQYTVPLGQPEILRSGTDITLVTYGSCVRIAEQACEQLAEHGIAVELIDVQTLLPFDIHHTLVASLQKTNRVLFVDEDVPGAATAYMLQQVVEVQQGYRYLDAAPQTLTAQAHRPPYGSDGDYFSKPNVEDVVEKVWEMMEV